MKKLVNFYRDRKAHRIGPCHLARSENRSFVSSSRTLWVDPKWRKVRELFSFCFWIWRRRSQVATMRRFHAWLSRRPTSKHCCQSVKDHL